MAGRRLRRRGRAARAAGFAWERRPIGWLRILTTGVVGFLTAVLLSAPFGLTVIGVSATAPFLDSSLLRLVFSTAATYPYLTVNAYNLWALFPVDGQSAATAGGALWIPDSPVNAGRGVRARSARSRRGSSARSCCSRSRGRRSRGSVARRPDRLTILVGVTRPRARVLRGPDPRPRALPVPVLRRSRAILLAFSWRWRIVYVVAAVATFLNMYVVLVAFYRQPAGLRLAGDRRGARDRRSA